MKQIIFYFAVFVIQTIILAGLADLIIHFIFLKHYSYLRRLKSDKMWLHERTLRWEMYLTQKIVTNMVYQTYFHIIKDHIMTLIEQKEDKDEVERLSEVLSTCYIRSTVLSKIIPSYYRDEDINANSYPLTHLEVSDLLEHVPIPGCIKSPIIVYDYYILNKDDIQKGFNIKFGKYFESFGTESVDSLYREKYTDKINQYLYHS